jgi:hypothetical protein
MYPLPPIWAPLLLRILTAVNALRHGTEQTKDRDSRLLICFLHLELLLHAGMGLAVPFGSVTPTP